ncbi:MAG: hypothetical protein JWQ02_2293 [Capsulimonas sp.]|jgi:hypothetical protein|nr:hypothetical protein [Capsulimonas sp.]
MLIRASWTVVAILMWLTQSNDDAFLRQKRHEFACAKTGPLNVPFVQAMLDCGFRFLSSGTNCDWKVNHVRKIIEHHIFYI